MSRSLRHFLKMATARWTVPIRSGPLAGLRWGVGTGMRFLLGRYEEEKAGAMSAALPEGGVFYDVGAHVGYFSVLASRCVGPSGRVFAFEPRPLNLRFLHRHLEVNGIRNVRVIEAAVGETPGRGRFRDDTGSATGHLTRGEGIDVQVVAIDDLLAAGELPPPDVIKIDVEGGEVGVLRGAAGTLEAHRPFLLVATHDEETHRDTLELLGEAGYRWRLLDAPDHGRKDVELVAEPV